MLCPDVFELCASAALDIAKECNIPLLTATSQLDLISPGLARDSSLGVNATGLDIGGAERTGVVTVALACKWGVACKAVVGVS